MEGGLKNNRMACAAVQDGLCVHEQHKLVDKVMFQLYELQDRAITAERRAANLEAALKKVRRQLRLRKETPPMIMASAAAEANREHSNRSSSTRCSLLRVRRPGAGARPGAASVASRRQVASGSAGPCGAHAAQVRHRVAGALLAEMFQV
ncbi:unnamed protein product [Durusdinium trenchii]|uniref:Uncharacterized protein n=1 Tax=Durusdinium trenchii TaxID=1381693 RepID=A0ABP0LNN7_9DINO